jgi:hypothetical protein
MEFHNISPSSRESVIMDDAGIQARSEEDESAHADEDHDVRKQDMSLPMDKEQVLQNGSEVVKNNAVVVSEECYVCLTMWEDVTERVLIPSCRHAVCVACAMSLRQVERNSMTEAKRSLKDMDQVQCGLCRHETILHVEYV